MKGFLKRNLWTYYMSEDEFKKYFGEDASAPLSILAPKIEKILGVKTVNIYSSTINGRPAVKVTAVKATVA